MARQTVNQIMTQIAATVNQEADAPSAGSAEYSLWIEYINRAIDEWSQSHDWDVLRRVYSPQVLGISQATVRLSDDFRKLSGPVKLHFDGEEMPKEFPIELPERAGMHSPTDEFITIYGDSSVGQSILFHPGTLASGASLEVQYFSNPTYISNATQMTPVPDNQYVVDRVVAYIFESRSDPRFQIMESKAKDKLLIMVENANAATYSSYSNQNPVMSTLGRIKWRIGRD